MISRKAAFPRIRDQRGDSNAGVSEVVGAILLISVTVIAVAIISVVLFSMNTPTKVPNVNFMVGIDNKVPPTLYLTHNGGDSLSVGSFSVYVDGALKSKTVAGGGDWSLGKNLLVPLAPGQTPQRVVLVYNQTGSGSAVIGAVSANVSVPIVNVVPAIIFPSPPPIFSGEGYIFNDARNISNSPYFIPAIQLNLSVNSISFWKATTNKGTPSGTSLTCDGLCYAKDKDTYWFKFKVTDTTSSSAIFYGNPGSVTKVPLNNGDVVNISLQSDTISYIEAFGIAPSIWEFAGREVTLNIKFANGTSYPQQKNTEITHMYVTSYAELVSTYNLDVWSTNTDTNLVVNGTTRISGLNSTDIRMTNLHPVPTGLFVIYSDTNNNNLYFVGDADQIFFNRIAVQYL